MRLPLDLIERLRALVPQNHPLFVRISATDWVDGGWDIEQSVIFCRELKTRGVDLIDVSSGGLVPKASIPVGRSFQVPLASRIREDSGIMTGAVGLITEVDQADDIITEGDADLILLGREILRDPYWAINAQHELEEEPTWPTQYGYAVKRRAK
jgi:2,4-dienoyl-CoA reductase-like NADH-dependent reductase (Old Yellow Enzyme family)